jgi:hypothetical protein
MSIESRLLRLELRFAGPEARTAEVPQDLLELLEKRRDDLAGVGIELLEGGDYGPSSLSPKQRAALIGSLSLEQLEVLSSLSTELLYQRFSE